MFQDILINFGTTISKVCNNGEYNEKVIIINVLKKAINTNFSEDIISEYIKKGKETELYVLLYLMGLLINEKYATYGLRLNPSIKVCSSQVKKIYDSIYKITDSLFDLGDEEYQTVEIPTKKTSIPQRKRILKVVKEYDFDI